MKRLLLITAILYACQVSGQNGFTFNRISTDDGLGLASNVVYCTYQDSKGFIWVGTANGLQRFDGSKFITFGRSNPQDKFLPISDLTQILDAGNGKLWLFFAARMEIGLFDPVKFAYTVVPIRPKGSFPARANFRVWKDPAGQTYISAWKYGMLRYDEKQNAFVDDHSFPFPPGWVSGIDIFYDDVKNQYWFPCPDSGLLVYDVTSHAMYSSRNNPLQIPLLKNESIQSGVTEFFIDGKRRHWVFNWTGVQNKRCFDETGRLLPDTAGINENKEYSELTRFLYTRQGVLWVYGNNGLFNFDNNESRFFFYNQAGPGDANIRYQNIYNIMEDRDGSIWLCTDNGLYFTFPGSGTNGVMNMLFSEAKRSVDFTDILQLQSGEYWLSTWGSGVYALDKHMKKYDPELYKNMPAMDPVSKSQYSQLWALMQDHAGNVWVGCQGGRYMIHDPVTKKTQFSYLRESDSATIRYITEDQKGNVWIATQRGHLIKYDGKTFSRVQFFGTIIHKVLVDNKGELWLATFNQGLYHLSSDGKTIIRHYTNDTKEDALFLNTGRDIDQLNDSTIGYGAGALNLISTKTGHVKWISFDDGLPSNTIQRIRVDHEGNAWIITLNGLCRYNPTTGRVTPYGKKDGITLANITTAADLKCHENFIMFTGSNALMYFLPSVFDNKQPPPDVVITDIKLFNDFVPVDSLSVSKEPRFSSSQNSFTFYFSALSFQQKDKLTYYYKLEGVDKEWNKADRSNFVNYPLLPPGQYTFAVYCENIDGIRSKGITLFHFYIRPPFWKTWWFIGLALIATLGLIYYLHRMRIHRILAVEQIRNRVARDLHDDMGSTLSTINILSSMAKSKLNTDTVKTSEYISKISDNSQRMMEAMDDIVWSIKPANDSMQKITARMREFATSVLEAKNIELSFRAEDSVHDVKLNMEARRDFFLIFKEAVNNVAKYSQCKQARVHISVHNSRLVLIVEDDGKGFDAQTVDSGNGLGNMQKRAEALKGRLLIDSTPGKGSRVTLNIPVQ